MPTEILAPALKESPDSQGARRAGLFPFFHQLREGERLEQGGVTEIESEYRQEDYEDCKYMINYRRDCGWDLKAKRGQKIYNVLQTFQPEDEISRIFLGYTRTSIDQGINQMTEGEPDFDFEPFGPADHLKVIIWKHMIRMVLSECDYKLHQGTFFRDFFVMGCGVFEVFVDYPQRTIRVPNPAYPGGFEPVVVQDHRRPKVGVRAVNPMDCWRNPNIDTPNAVPSCLRRRIITWNQMAQEFGRCMDADGNPRYRNMEKLARGSHACVYYYQDEIRDVYRIYLKTFGNQSDGFAQWPVTDDLGICVLDTTLKIHEETIAGVVRNSTGLNMPGICSLRWGILYDKYDKNYLGNHNVYGMGLPERIEGEDTAIQGIFNQNLDNFRWASTVALNYEGSNADSYLDVDANRLYGGELIDGKITPQPLGINRITDTQGMMEMMDNSTIPATGINHNQLIGDSSKTLGEFALRIRQSNRGAEQRLTRLESELFKPIGSLLLANTLSTLTVGEYEDMTEEQVQAAKSLIKSGQRPLSDYKDLNGEKPQRRQLKYVPLKGEKIRETFKITKKRQLDYNAPFKGANSTNTLIKDPKMKVETSYVPLVMEYVDPTGYIESGQMPKCIADSKRMLADVKNQDVKNVQTTINFILQLVALGYKGADFDKMVSVMLDFAEIDPKLIMNTDNNGSQTLDMIKQLNQKLKENQQAPSPQPNAQVPQPMAPQGNPGVPVSDDGGLGSPANAFQAAASGAL